jgi:glycosyltransferase involved in cell wall biosynthesis
MKILHVITDSNIGGAGILLCNLLEHLDRKQFQSVVALPFGSALRERILALGVPVRELEISCDRLSLDSVREIKRLIKREKPDLVHANAAISARVAGKLAWKKVIHTRHCYYPIRAQRSIGSALRRLGNALLTDAAIATADAAADNLMELGVSPNAIHVIPNGTPPVREVSEAELEEFRRTHGIADEDFCVGICARLVPCKGHTVFLRAAARTMENSPQIPFRFLIAGEGPEKDKLERLTARLGISDRVSFLGFLSDTAPFYRSLRINVNCSSGTETSCLAISEGMSASLPTVVSCYGGNRAMIGQSGAGICFAVGDHKALADAICKIADNPELESSMRCAARRRYLAKFTAEKMARRVEQVYRQSMR